MPNANLMDPPVCRILVDGAGMTETRFTAAPTDRYERPSMAGVVLGNYRLISEISTGGMGTVYRAKHELLGRPAAVKLLRPDLDANQELIDRFFLEAKAATAIKHPGIIEIYDFGYDDQGSAYLVMELLEGKPLGRALRDVERFSEGEAANIARGIASALKAAHAQGIFHRDLKPDNVFLVPDLDGQTGAMRPKVLDFGIAKLATRAPDEAQHTKLGALMGTPVYMAPEQAREASAIDHRADLYSLGCILYELIVGWPPFVAEGAGEIVAMHLMTPPEPPRKHVPEISIEMEAIVMRLLAKDPAQRYQTAGEVASALAEIVRRVSPDMVSSAMSSGPRVVHRHVPTTLRQAELPREAPPRRRSLPIIAGAITATIAIAVIVFLVVRGAGSSDEHRPLPTTPSPRIESSKPAPTGTPPPPPVKDSVETAPVVKPVKPMAPATKPTKPPPAPKRGPTTPNGSPIFEDL
jgi:serine/threonine protein kinase